MIPIVGRTGAPEVGHPFHGHSSSAKDSDQGIAREVLASASMQKLLRVVKAQCVEQAIETPRYLIGATGNGSCKLKLSRAFPQPL